ncbi:MAG: NAD(P)/FAD-dependent oxidoreductase, partial [Bacillota bacterium]|nr:NAD(P)/FAD-dependent oxidoreductase [Bacillota bacterium]
IGIENTGKFINVDERMRVAKGVWAMGDVTGKALLTSVADYQSAIIAADILGREHPPASYHAIPRVIFTDPEVGAVGMTESEARAAGLEVMVILKEVAFSIRGFLHGAEKGIIKLVANRKSGILVGATVVGPHAGEVLGFLSLAVHARIPIPELQSMIYGFPTFYGGIGEAIGAYARGVTTVFDPSYDIPEL